MQHCLPRRIQEKHTPRQRAARGDATTAREILQRVEARGPTRPSSWYALGLAYEETGDVSLAQSAFHRALEAGDFPDAADAT
ncbi:MAG: tetratricopeptide repeat protein, partial [Planctomycetes bacterium]|nr:tetratricopeptide repeat protein [Planctomycetota bacterium]